MKIKSPRRKKAEDTFISNQFHPPWGNHQSQTAELCVYVQGRMNVGRPGSQHGHQPGAAPGGGLSGDRIC